MLSGRRCWLGLTALMTALAPTPAPATEHDTAYLPEAARLAEAFEQTHGPLSRVREGGPPADNPDQSLHPFAVSLPDGPGAASAPSNGLVASPPEYSPSAGVIFRFSTSAWPTVVRDCVVALTQNPAYNDIAYVVVASGSQQNNATNSFTAAGADMSKVRFIQFPNDSIWLRDYGPHFIWQSNNLAIVDSHYYPNRPQDNFIPTLLADDYFFLPSYDIGLYYSGGNFQPGPNRNGFVTSLVQQDNPGFGTLINEQYQAYQGIDTLHIMPRLPSSVDGTGHIDMWMYLVDADTVVISQFLPGSNPSAISITDNAVPYMQGLGFQVHRTPAWNVGSTHFTYANAFRVNNRIFIPTYGQGNPAYLASDAQALATWQTAAGPGVQIVGINSFDIIPAAGAIHCIVMQVPKFTSAGPAAHVMSPAGGELLVPGVAHDIRWVATDDLSVTGVDLRYSTDGGATYPHLIVANHGDTGQYSWTVPALNSTQCRVKVVARDADGHSAEAVSENTFTIRPAERRVYDFATEAAVDRWGWGYQSLGWFSIDSVRRPVDVNLHLPDMQADAYARLATSNGTGTDFDANRYIAWSPGNGFETSHIFEFTIEEDPADILDIHLRWEGYGDDCIQMELYVWDYVQNNWGDARGRFGENRYLDNFAGNRDADLVGRIDADFDRYLGPEGKLTLLVYGERPSQESFHDYVSVTVTSDQALQLDYNVLCEGGGATYHSGYIDPRLESDNGTDLNLGLNQFALTFTDRVFNLAGGDVTPADFTVTQTGAGEPPHVLAVDAGANPQVTVTLDRRITLREWTTIRAHVQDAEGNAIDNQGDLGGGADEPDRIDVGFLPGDIDQNGSVQPLDLLRYRQVLSGVFGNPCLDDEAYGDTDRSGTITPLDLLRFRQLLAGTAPATQAWSGRTMNNARP